jgi:hypothetical protein
LLRRLDELLGGSRPHVSVEAVVGADHRDDLVDHVLRVELALHDLGEVRFDIRPAVEVHLVVLPAVGRVGDPVVEARQVRTGIDRLHCDVRRLELGAQGRRDRLERVLGGAAGAEAVGRQQATHRAEDDDAASRAAVNELADDVLSELEVREGVEVPPGRRHRVAGSDPA